MSKCAKLQQGFLQQNTSVANPLLIEICNKFLWVCNGFSTDLQRKNPLQNCDFLVVLFMDFHKSYAELSHFFMALEQANLRCVATWKTFDNYMPNIEVFQRVF